MSKQAIELNRFGTGLMAMDYFLFPQPPFRGKSWSAALGAPRPDIGGTNYGDTIHSAREVVILSRDFVNAQRAANLIHSAFLVLDGSALLSDLHPGQNAPIRALRDNLPANRGCKITPRNGLRIIAPHIPLACMVAARASFRLALVYALTRLRLSLETFSLPSIELDPIHSPTIAKSPLPDDHARLASAIVSAWSCIEELGFGVHASEKNPSRLEDGTWNPSVKANLEERLRRGHVNLDEHFYWSLRGQRTRIERKRPPQLVKKASWARYDVRDGEMEVIDAINQVSFLRSKVSTHKTDKRMLRVLSVYDASNAQFLARRLLLERLRYWRYLERTDATVNLDENRRRML